MRILAIKYSFVYVVPAVVIFSLYSSGILTWSAVILLFVIIPVMELFTRGSESNLGADEEAEALKNNVYDYLLYLIVPIQYMLLILFLFQMENNNLEPFELLGKISSMGMACGVLGINVAHELGHRNKSSERILAKVLLLSSLYMHFYIEHNRGHHKRVGTPEDPATARYGETVYFFFFRSIIGSWLSSWQLEQKRLAKKGTGPWTLKNEMLRFQLIQIAFILVIWFTFSWLVMIYFIGAAFIGILLLETVNYIEHYGLTRKKTEKGYERTKAIHSWNSNHPLGRLILFELSRHSDHHYKANRKYQVLRHHEESPQMPTGYAGMMLLSLLPPLWFRVMHKRIGEI